jgi:hypothetical protein
MPHSSLSESRLLDGLAVADRPRRRTQGRDPDDGERAGTLARQPRLLDHGRRLVHPEPGVCPPELSPCAQPSMSC